MVISSLPPEFEQFVQTQVASGRFGSPEEVVCVALREMQHQQQLVELRREIEVGIEQLERGEAIIIRNDAELRAYFDDVQARGERRLAERNQS